MSKKLIRHLLASVLCLLLLPLTLALHLAGFRRVTVFTDRIGHLAFEPDCLLKEAALGLIPRRRWFILALPGRVSNRHLLTYWKQHLYVVENGPLCFVLASMGRMGLLRQDVSRYLNASMAQEACAIQANWGDRPPLLTLSDEDRAWGQAALSQLGLPNDAWFVCLHVREGGFSPIDESLQAHRNGSIEAAIPAAQAIVAHGGWVIRIGDPTMAPLPALPGIIDYAHHPLKSERLDIVLCARARFILGSTSGIALAGTIFGTPCAIANVIPISTRWFNSQDISIPKLLWSNQLSRYLTFAEIMASPLASFGYASLYAKADIQIEENSADDIRNLALEMLARMQGSFIESKTDEAAWQQIKDIFQPQHLGYGSCARIATSFVRHHQTLMLSVRPSVECGSIRVVAPAALSTRSGVRQ